MTDWTTYVRDTIGTDKQVDVARKTGIDQTTISRWLNPDQEKNRRISSQAVAAFARGYGKSVIHAFVVAGFLTSEEAGLTEIERELGKVPSEALANELVSRANRLSS